MKTIKVSCKIALLWISTCFFSEAAQSQLVNDGGSISITNGASVFTAGSFINTSAGTVDNNGEIVTGIDLINNSAATLSGNGVYKVQADFTNNGMYSQDNSTLNFYGAFNSDLKNQSGNIYILQVNKDSGFLVNLLDNEKVINKVSFLNNYNWVRLNNRILTLGSSCQIQNFGNKKFFITNGTGRLKKQHVDNVPFIFPVGFSKSTYNRVTITENGTADTYSVRCRESALLNGTTGSPISADGIKAGWVITENTPGGASAVIEGEWRNPNDELPGFDYTKCRLVRYTNNGWDYSALQAGTASGTTYRHISRSGLSNFGEFTVLSNNNPTISSQFAEVNSLNNTAINNNGLRVYPKLVRNTFNIEVPGGYRQPKKMNITIIDAAGAIVWIKQNADFMSQQISLPGLTSGIYTVLINYENKKFAEKIILSH